MHGGVERRFRHNQHGVYAQGREVVLASGGIALDGVHPK